MTEIDTISEERDGTSTFSSASIHTVLMEAIRSGRYLPGAQLPNERKLAEMYGTSRQQVRDALLILSGLGLVSRKVGSGTWLSENAPQIIANSADEEFGLSPTEPSLLEVIETRLIIEPGVAGLAARHVNETHVKAMKLALDAINKPAKWTEFKSSISQFVRSYYVASGNRFLLRTYDEMTKGRLDHQVDSLRENSEVAPIIRNHTSEQLAQIFRAVADGDEIRAETVTRQYLIGLAALSSWA